MKFHQKLKLVNIVLVMILTIGIINYFPGRALAADHPCVLHSQAQIDDVKQKIQLGQQPWSDAFDDLIVKANESLSHVSQAVQDFYAPGYYSDPDASIAAKTLIVEDGSAAYFCALAYQLDESSNRTQYADKAVELLNSWASINESVSGTDGNEYMITGGMGLIQAADLVWNYSGWESTDRDNFAVWVSTVFQNCGNALKGRKPNLGSWGTWGSISAACLVENQSTIDSDINLMKDKVEDIIASDGHMPYDTQYEGKGIWYTYYGLAPLTAAFQAVLNATGTDLFHYTSPNGRNIKMALDNLFYYSQHPDEWPYYSGDVTNIPSTDSWPGNLFMAMAGIFDEQSYEDWVTSGGPVSDSTWWDQLHIAWYFPVIMQPLIVPDTTPPVAFDIQPSGSLAYGTTQTTISLTTDEPATCKYSTVPGVSYDSMPNTFSTTGGTSHSTVIAGLVNGSSYTYYVKCEDTLGNQSADDFIVTFSVESAPSVIEDRTQIESISVFSTIENISVMAPFRYDDNENNNAVLEYRESGGTWKTAIEWLPGEVMWCDRRDYVVSYRIGPGVPTEPDGWGDPQPNPFYPTDGSGNPVESGGVFRATIFFLEPDTDYEVRVTFSDPDGVIGTNPLTSTIRTKNDNPPLTGTNYYVSTTGSDSNNGLSPSNAWATIQHAADTVHAGGIVNIMPGIYRGGITCYDNGGTENNYITFRSYDMNNKAIIDCEGIDQYAFRWKVPFLRFSGLVVKNTVNNGALFWANGESLTDSSTGVIIEDCQIENWGISWPSSGIYLPWVDGAIIQRNVFIRNIPDVSANCYGIMFANRRGSGQRTCFEDQCRNCAVRDNTFIGSMQDFVGGSGQGMNTHIYNNYGEGARDDAWSLDLWGVCCSGWGNTLNATPNLYSGEPVGMVVSIAPITVGPVYVFHNVSWNHRSGATKVGARSHGRGYIYHNTFVSEIGGGPLNFGDDNMTDNQVYRNNIFDLPGPVTIGASSGDPFYEPWSMDFDYDCYSRSGTFYWPDLSNSPLGLDYPETWITSRVGLNFSEFQSYAGMEIEGGFVADPMCVDPENLEFELQSGSPCIDMAMLVPGLNDANSPWPYSGSGPDMGAIEYDSGPAVDNNPPYTIGHDPAKGATGVARDTNIVVHVRDNGAGVDLSSIVMTVEGATVNPTITGTPANYTLTYNPPADFAYEQVVNVTINARDLASTPHVMTQDAYSFTIASEYSDSSPPYTTGHNPANGGIDIARDTNIVVHVKDDGEGVNQSSIVMAVEGTTVTPTITGTPADYTLTYNPPSDFDYEQVINVTVDARDLASTPNFMAQDAYSFTITSGYLDDAPPYVVGRNPARNAVDVERNTNIVVHVKDDGAGVDQSSIVMTVEGATVTPTITGTPAEYIVTYNPPSDFDYEQVVNITIDAQDLSSLPHIMTQDSYSFSIVAEGSQVISVPIRINCAGEEYADTGSNIWLADQSYNSGSWGFIGSSNSVDRGSIAIDGTNDDRIYQTERYGLDGYQFDLGNGTYDVTLHFAETYRDAVGERVFDIYIEEQLELISLDIYSEVGDDTALIKTFHNIAVNDEQLNIDFGFITENPIINGIVITDSTGNQPPLAVNDSYSMPADTTLNIPSPGILSNDTDDDGDSLTAILFSDVSHGNLTLNDNGSFIYTPDTGYTGTDSFTYNANDGQENSNIATVNLNVSETNQAPILKTIGDKTLTEGQTLQFTISATDPDGDSMIYTATNLPDGAGFNQSTRVFIWTTDTDDAGTYENIRFIVSDGSLSDYEDITITVEAAADISPAGGGGGGGGTRGVTSLVTSITPEGKMVSSINAMSSDLRVYLSIPTGTYCTIGDEAAIYWISIMNLEEDAVLPPAPEGSNVIMPYYELTPEGVNFSPSVQIFFKYLDSEIPEGADETELVIMWWDLVKEDWVPMDTHVDTVNNIAWAYINHFSMYTLMINPKPASFEISQFNIDNPVILTGETATVSAVVTNTGALSGSYEAVLIVDEEITDTQAITLDGGCTETLYFTITPDTVGTYEACIGDCTMTFTVKEPAVPATFVTTSLEATSATIELGETIGIDVIVTNAGELPGNYDTALLLDDVVSQTREVTVEGGQSVTVSFEIKPDSYGTHTASVNDLQITFEVVPVIDDIEESVRTLPEVRNLGISPVYDVDTGKLISARVNYQIVEGEELSPEAKLELYVYRDGEFLEKIPSLSLSHLQSNVFTSSLTYIPALGWKAGIYSIKAELINGDNPVQTTEPTQFTVTQEIITTAVSWKTLGVIIGSMLAVVSLTVVLILYRKRQILRDYF